jgi:hypothetical protein
MTIEFTHPQVDIPRDRWGRPLITPTDGGKPVPYTRVSTLSKELGSKEGLTKWLQRQVVVGMSLRPDLVDMAAACRGDDKKLDEVVKTAMVAAESEKAANIGTALHALSERVDEGVPLEEIPEHHRADMTAYKNATAGLTVLAKEMFVVTDEVQAAGTFDRLVRLPDGRTMVADLKTGKWEHKYPHATATQIAIYSHGHLYHPDKGRMGRLPDLGVETDTGVLIHMPAGTGECRLYLLDLTIGWALATAAVAVRTVLKSKPITEYVPTTS